MQEWYDFWLLLVDIIFVVPLDMSSFLNGLGGNPEFMMEVAPVVASFWLFFTDCDLFPSWLQSAFGFHIFSVLVTMAINVISSVWRVLPFV